MSEMVERVAKALSVADGFHPDACSNDSDEQPMWRLYVTGARAAIEAMREPTEAMIDAGDDIEIAVGEENRSIFCGERVWLVMHKVALCGAGGSRS